MARLRYLALGDSYTIGTGASDAERAFPSWLRRWLEETSGAEVILQNPAVNGYTTTDLIDRELPQAFRPPDLCTILIGANDIVQGRTPEGYRRNLGRIYDFAARFELPEGRVVAVSVPDFSVTPAASSFGEPSAILARIETFNAIAREESSARAFPYIDLMEVSRSGSGRPGWLSEDGLHPGDDQYRAWAEYIWPAVRKAWIAAAA